MSRRPKPNAVFQATRLRFDPGSRGCTSYVEALWSPALAVSARIASGIRREMFSVRCNAEREGLSLSGGASIRTYDFFKLSITFGWFDSKTTKATRRGRPRFEASMRSAG